MSRIFLDTNIFVYMVEDPGPRGKRAAEIFSELSLRGDEVLTSTLTLGELLVKPLEANDHALANRYKSALRGPSVRLLTFDEAAGEKFARIRLNRAIKAPDAIQLATAGTAGCDLFITNDERLTSARVPGVHFITSMERAPI